MGKTFLKFGAAKLLKKFSSLRLRVFALKSSSKLFIK